MLRSNIPKGPSVTPSPFHFDWNWRGLTEMGRELPLVVADNRFGILAENPRLRINNTSLHQSFFFLHDDMLFSIDGDGEVTYLHFRREGLNVNRHGCRTVYEAI